MDCHLHWRHVSTCYRVICAYCAYVTIRCKLGDTRCTPRHFVNKVSVRQFSAENKQESAEFYSQHLPMHSRDVIWKIKPKFNFPVSFSLVSAEMNLVGNYRTLRGLRTVNPEGLSSTRCLAACTFWSTHPGKYRWQWWPGPKLMTRSLRHHHQRDACVSQTWHKGKYLLRVKRATNPLKYSGPIRLCFSHDSLLSVSQLTVCNIFT